MLVEGRLVTGCIGTVGAFIRLLSRVCPLVGSKTVLAPEYLPTKGTWIGLLKEASVLVVIGRVCVLKQAKGVRVIKRTAPSVQESTFLLGSRRGGQIGGGSV